MAKLPTIALGALLALTIAAVANSLTDNDQNEMESLSRRGLALARDILNAVGGTNPTTNAYDCLNQIEEDADRLSASIQEMATLTQISSQMLYAVDERHVNEILVVTLNTNLRLIALLRNSVNRLMGLCANYAAVGAYGYQITNLITDFDAALRRIGRSITR